MRDKEALLGLLESHGPAIRRIARVYANATGEEEDLYQEIVLEAWKSLPSFRGKSSAGTWLYRVALNTGLTWRRRQSRRRDREVAVAEDQREREAAAPPAPLRSETEILRHFLSSVSGPNRTILVLYMEGLTHDEIAQITGLSASAVGVRIHRLKKVFIDRYVEGSA